MFVCRRGVSVFLSTVCLSGFFNVYNSHTTYEQKRILHKGVDIHKTSKRESVCVCVACLSVSLSLCLSVSLCLSLSLSLSLCHSTSLSTSPSVPLPLHSFLTMVCKTQTWHAGDLQK